MSIEELKRKKQELGYSCEQISELSGVPLGTVQKIFSGITKSPRYDTIRQLEKIFQTAEQNSYPNMLQDAGMPYRIGKRQGEYTMEDYRLIPEDRRVELIDGVIYDMDAPTNIHQQIAGEIHAILRDYVRRNKGQCIVSVAPTDVQLDCDEKTMVQPDVMVTCDREKVLPSHMYGAPDLVVEILSESTRKRDGGLKLGKYSQAGVREYWMVDPVKKKIVVYDFEHEELPVIYGFQDCIPVRIFGGECVIDFAEIYEYLRFIFEKEKNC